MTKKIYLVLGVCTLFMPLLFACSSTTSPSFGPVKDDQFQTIISENFLEDEEEIIFYSRAIWFANKNGFKFFPAGKKSRKGVFICSNQAVYFSEWKAKRYMPVFTARYEEITEHRLAANELFGRLVVKAQNYNSFEILGVSGPDLPNKEETEVAFEIIQHQKQ